MGNIRDKSKKKQAKKYKRTKVKKQTNSRCETCGGSHSIFADNYFIPKCCCVELTDENLDEWYGV